MLLCNIKIKFSTYLFAAFFLGFFLQSAYADDKNAAELLRKADEYRNFQGQSFSFDLILISYQPSRKPNKFELRAEIKDSHTSLITYTSPVSEKGKALLMNGRNLWFYTPSSRKSLRITPQQRLLGEASNGDVASTDFSGDYDASFAGEETIDGIAYHLLDLTAKKDSMAVYHQLRLWISKVDHAPFKAHFFTLSGKHIKTANYKSYDYLDSKSDKPQLTEIEIVSIINKGRRTVMKYSNFERQVFNDAKFNPLSLKRSN